MLWNSLEVGLFINSLRAIVAYDDDGRVNPTTMATRGFEGGVDDDDPSPGPRGSAAQLFSLDPVYSCGSECVYDVQHERCDTCSRMRVREGAYLLPPRRDA